MGVSAGKDELTCIKMRNKLRNITIVLLLLASFSQIQCKVSDQRQCADPECKSPEEVVEEKEENAEKPTENENLKNEFTEKTQPQAPPNTNIEKTEQIEDQQFETKNPELQIPVVESANTEVVSSFSPPVESQSAEVSGTST